MGEQRPGEKMRLRVFSHMEGAEQVPQVRDSERFSQHPHLSRFTKEIYDLSSQKADLWLDLSYFKTICSPLYRLFPWSCTCFPFRFLVNVLLLLFLLFWNFAFISFKRWGKDFEIVYSKGKSNIAKWSRAPLEANSCDGSCHNPGEILKDQASWTLFPTS